MIKSFSKISLHVVFTCLLLVLSTSSNAYYSNDPQGKMFIEKPFGDTSNCGPLPALMVSKFVNGNKNYTNIRAAIDEARMSVQKQKKIISTIVGGALKISKSS